MGKKHTAFTHSTLIPRKNNLKEEYFHSAYRFKHTLTPSKKQIVKKHLSRWKKIPIKMATVSIDEKLLEMCVLGLSSNSINMFSKNVQRGEFELVIHWTNQS